MHCRVCVPLHLHHREDSVPYCHPPSVSMLAARVVCVVFTNVVGVHTRTPAAPHTLSVAYTRFGSSYTDVHSNKWYIVLISMDQWDAI